MKYSNYLEQHIGRTGHLHVHINSGTYEFEISRRVVLFEKKYMLITVGDDFVILAKGQEHLEDDVNKYDQTIIPLQRFLMSISKRG